MKKIFTLVLAAMAATGAMAQMHGVMVFSGESQMAVSTMNVESESDTVTFAMVDMTSGNITLPAMKATGMPEIPSFTINDVEFSMGANHVVNFADQEFNTTVMVGDVEKNVTGTSLSGTYDMADNSLTLDVTFKYGSMPFPITYNVKAYYVKPVTNAISVVVGGMFTYTNESVTYNVRKYNDEGTEKVDVQVPEYRLDGTVMGDLTLGSYVIKGLVYDEAKGGYYRDYKDDGLSFHFVAKNNGAATMDNDYSFNSSKDNDILVKYSGNNITSIVNKFQMGAMPFPIETTFGGSTTGINQVNTDIQPKAKDAVYNLNGQRVGANTRGIVIINGKKYLNK